MKHVLFLPTTLKTLESKLGLQFDSDVDYMPSIHLTTSLHVIFC